MTVFDSHFRDSRSRGLSGQGRFYLCRTENGPRHMSRALARGEEEEEEEEAGWADLLQLGGEDEG